MYLQIFGISSTFWLSFVFCKCPYVNGKINEFELQIFVIVFLWLYRQAIKAKDKRRANLKTSLSPFPYYLQATSLQVVSWLVYVLPFDIEFNYLIRKKNGSYTF